MKLNLILCSPIALVIAVANAEKKIAALIMTEHIDKQVESAIDYYLRFAIKNRLVLQAELQQSAITQFNLNDRQIAEFRLKIYQLNMEAQYDPDKH